MLIISSLHLQVCLCSYTCSNLPHHSFASALYLPIFALISNLFLQKNFYFELLYDLDSSYTVQSNLIAGSCQNSYGRFGSVCLCVDKHPLILQMYVCASVYVQHPDCSLLWTNDPIIVTLGGHLSAQFQPFALRHHLKGDDHTTAAVLQHICVCV